MSKRRDGLKPGEVARAKRVAKKIADAVGTDSPSFIGSGRPVAVRNVVARLRVQQLRPRDLDTPNGTDAIAAIVSTMTKYELLGENPPPMTKIWELITSRALQYLTAEMRRQYPYRASLPPPISTSRRPGLKVWG